MAMGLLSGSSVARAQGGGRPHAVTGIYRPACVAGGTRLPGYAVAVGRGVPLTLTVGDAAGWRLSAGGVAVAAVASRARNAPSSPMVLINGAGNTTVVLRSTPISTRLCR